MEKSIRYWLMTIALAICSLHCVALGIDVKKDTISFYSTWRQMLNKQPVFTMTEPDVKVYSQYDIYIASVDSINDKINNQYIALSVGDSIWMINSVYIRKNFEGDVQYFDRYIPVIFNDKVAVVMASAPLTIKELFDGTGEREGGNYTTAYFFLDFENRWIDRVTHTFLIDLLKDYHDLLMRYEGMRDYKKPHIIEDFLLRYIDRVEQDVTRPCIVDLID